MARYKVEGVSVNHPALGVEEFNMITDLATAKALSQVEADRIRVAEHRRKQALTWTRQRSGVKTNWVGSIKGREYVRISNGETKYVRF